MPRIRTIKPKFWDDIKLSKISRDARLLFIGIWNFSDDLGVIVAEPVYIKSKVFPYDKLEPNQLDFWLNELIEKKFIIPITHKDEMFFFIRTFSNHQRIEKPNHDDICIGKEELMKLKDQSRINPVSIPYQSETNPVSITGGRDSKGKDKEWIGEDGKTGLIPESFCLFKIYDKPYKQLNGHFKNLTENGFDKWKKFIDFIYQKDLSAIFQFNCINPTDFEKLDFPENKWDETIKAILSTGIKPEHNLLYRIPQFLKYSEKPVRKAVEQSDYEKKIEADREKARHKNYD